MIFFRGMQYLQENFLGILPAKKSGKLFQKYFPGKCSSKSASKKYSRSKKKIK